MYNITYFQTIVKETNSCYIYVQNYNWIQMLKNKGYLKKQ